MMRETKNDSNRHTEQLKLSTEKNRLFYDVQFVYSTHITEVESLTDTSFYPKFQPQSSARNTLLARFVDRRKAIKKLSENGSVAQQYMTLMRLATTKTSQVSQELLEKIKELSRKSSELNIDWHDVAMRQEPDLFLQSKAITGLIDAIREWREKTPNIERRILHKHLFTTSRYIVSELYDANNLLILQQALDLQPWKITQATELYGLSKRNIQTEQNAAELLEKAIASIIEKPFQTQTKKRLIDAALYMPIVGDDLKSYPSIEAVLLSLHPMKLLHFFDLFAKKYKEHLNPNFLIQHGIYCDIVEDHQTASSTLNRVVSGWRTYAGLNLNLIKNSVQNFLFPSHIQELTKNVKNKSRLAIRKIINAISFDETRNISMTDLSTINNQNQKIKDPVEQLFDHFFKPSFENHEDLIASSAYDVFNYEYNEWQTDQGQNPTTINKFFQNHDISSTFCRYNRGAVRSKEARILLPLKGMVAYLPDERKYSFFLENGDLKTASSEQLETLFMLAKKRRFLEAIKYCHQNLNMTDIRKTRQIISELGSLPVLIIKKYTNNEPTKTSTQLQNITTQEANAYRDMFPTSNMIVVANVFDSNLILSMNTNHDPWDGAHSQRMLDLMSKKISQQIIKNPQLFGLSTESPITNSTDYSSTPPEVGIFPDLGFLEKSESYTAIQINVEATGFFNTANKIASIARKYKKEGKISKDSKLTSPSLITQLMLLQKYSQIAIEQNVIKNHDALGILMGGKTIDGDLDLLRVLHGFDAKDFLKSDSERQLLVLQTLDNQLQSAHSNILRYIIPFIESLPTFSHLPMNKISMMIDEVISSLQGKTMISGFGFERFNLDGTWAKITSDMSVDDIATLVNEFRLSQALTGVASAGPALTPSQIIALTICHAHYDINNRGKLDKIYLSIRIKHRFNLLGYKLAQEMLNYINSYN